MKRKELKNTLVTLAILLAVIIMTLMFRTCGQDNRLAGADLQFRSADAALHYYSQYNDFLSKSEIQGTDEFIDEMTNWRYISDTVYHYLIKDSIYINNVEISRHYAMIHDSIRDRLVALSVSWKYSYKDVIRVKQFTSAFADDEETLKCAREAAPFFNSLDSNATFSGDKKEILSEYARYLRDIKNKGIYDKDDVLMYIRREDVLFRSFLAHLDEMNDEAVVDITNDTDTVCNNIFKASRDGRISPRETMVYMSMRTARRLLQNSLTCLNNLDESASSDRTGDAYKWMILQPFVSIDQFAMATMNTKDRIKFDIIAELLASSRNFANSYGVALDTLNQRLPKQLMKIYILTL